MSFPCVQPPQDVLKACRYWLDEGVKAVVVQWFQGVFCRGVPSAGATMGWIPACLITHGDNFDGLYLCSGQSLNGFHFKK
jgi:hypothetical protein